jgi:MFS superfamily sulfate permease-like transporter
MVMSFVPHALMAGFCSGAAIVIALSQMTNIMGNFCIFFFNTGLVSACTIRISQGEKSDRLL